MDEPRARTLYDRGVARWPDLALPFASFCELVRGHLEKLGDLGEAEICAEDLFLVACCRASLPGAVDRFDAFVWPQLESHLRRMRGEAEWLHEMRQTLLVRLFVPDAAGEPARIDGYTGRGALIVWLRMAAARLALNAKRNEKRTTGLTDSYPERAAAASFDIELSFIRGRYEADFVASLRAALAALDDEQRLLLQFRYREQLTSDQIAVLLKTSRVTAHRRVVAAREALAEHLRETLRKRLLLSQSGLEQLLGLLSSKLVPALTAELRDGLA